MSGYCPSCRETWRQIARARSTLEEVHALMHNPARLIQLAITEIEDRDQDASLLHRQLDLLQPHLEAGWLRLAPYLEDLS